MTGCYSLVEKWMNLESTDNDERRHRHRLKNLSVHTAPRWQTDVTTVRECAIVTPTNVPLQMYDCNINTMFLVAGFSRDSCEHQVRTI